MTRALLADPRPQRTIIRTFVLLTAGGPPPACVCSKSKRDMPTHRGMINRGRRFGLAAPPLDGSNGNVASVTSINTSSQ